MHRILCMLLTICLLLSVAPVYAVEETAATLQEKTITRDDIILVLDPGHGGSDPGASANGLKESENNLSISLKVAELMRGWGCQVVMTRDTMLDDNTYLSLPDRTSLANKLPADIFVSIHTNSMDLSENSFYASINGITTFYQQSTQKGLQLARYIQEAVVHTTGAKDRGVASNNLFVTRETDMDAVLVEVGFLTNPQEAAKMKTDSYRQQLADGIAAGIQRYVEEVTIPQRQQEENDNPTQEIPSNQMYRVTASSLYCRVEPNENGRILTAFSQGTIVYTVGKETKEWLYVTDGTITGWCSKEYLEAVEATALPKQYQVTASALNCRAQPVSTAPVVGMFYQGMILTALGDPVDGWLPVSGGGIHGWCSLEYLEEQVQETEEYVVVAETSVNCRESASMSGKILGSISRGTVVTVTGGVINGWMYVTDVAQGLTGWCSAEYLQKGSYLPVPEWINPFTDLTISNWAYESIARMCQIGLFTGVSEDRFSHQGTMNRAMAVQILKRISDSDSSLALTPGEAPVFSDVPQNQWYYQAVSWAGAVGLSNGTSEDLFSPLNSMTREQLAVMLYRYAELLGLVKETNGNLDSFPDGNSVSSWAEEAMNWCVGVEIINGVNGSLEPQGSATRAQMAAMVQRFLSAMTA